MTDNDIVTAVAISEILNNETKKEVMDNRTKGYGMKARIEKTKKEVMDNRTKGYEMKERIKRREEAQAKKERALRLTQEKKEPVALRKLEKDAIYSSNNSMSEKLKALGFYIQILKEKTDQNKDDINDKIKKINDFKNDIQTHVIKHDHNIQFIKTLDSEKLYPVAIAPDKWDMPTVEATFIPLKRKNGEFKDDGTIEINNIKPISYPKSTTPITPTTPTTPTTTHPVQQLEKTVNDVNNNKIINEYNQKMSKIKPTLSPIDEKKTHILNNVSMFTNEQINNIFEGEDEEIEKKINELYDKLSVKNNENKNNLTKFLEEKKEEKKEENNKICHSYKETFHQKNKYCGDNVIGDGYCSIWAIITGILEMISEEKINNNNNCIKIMDHIENVKYPAIMAEDLKNIKDVIVSYIEKIQKDNKDDEETLFIKNSTWMKDNISEKLYTFLKKYKDNITKAGHLDNSTGNMLIEENIDTLKKGIIVRRNFHLQVISRALNINIFQQVVSNDAQKKPLQSFLITPSILESDIKEIQTNGFSDNINDLKTELAKDIDKPIIKMWEHGGHYSLMCRNDDYEFKNEIWFKNIWENWNKFNKTRTVINDKLFEENEKLTSKDIEKNKRLQKAFFENQ